MVLGSADSDLYYNPDRVSSTRPTAYHLSTPAKLKHVYASDYLGYAYDCQIANLVSDSQRPALYLIKRTSNRFIICLS